MTTTTPRIYVACLAAYNAGRLHGRWIDATIGADAIHEQIEQMLAESPEPGAEEFAIHDHEGLGDIGEHESIERIAELAEAIDDAGDDAPALLAWLDAEAGRDPSDFAEVFRGQWDSLADYAEHLHEEMGWDADKAANGSWWHPARYTDWERMGRDLELSGDVETHPAPGGIYVYDRG